MFPPQITTTVHVCPPSTSTSLLPVSLSFLICSSYPRRSLSARSHSSRPATAQVQLLIVVPPASLCCLLVASASLLAYARECNTTPSPWWLLCLHWSVYPPFARQSGYQELLSQSLSMSVPSIVLSTVITLISPASAERSGRNEKWRKRRLKNIATMCSI